MMFSRVDLREADQGAGGHVEGDLTQGAHFAGAGEIELTQQMGDQTLVVFHGCLEPAQGLGRIESAGAVRGREAGHRADQQGGTEADQENGG
jgi:hypothetical protein